MTSNKIRFRFVGSRSNGDLRLDDFITQLSAIKKALTETDRAVSGTKLQNPAQSEHRFRFNLNTDSD